MAKAFKWIVLIAAGAALAAALVIVILGWKNPRAQYFTVEPEPVPVPADPEAVERGRYFAHAIAVCGVCHGEDLGGQNMSDSAIWGYVFTPNLTRGEGGVGHKYDVVDWVRAIRHGVDADGRAFAFMPVDHYFYITDADLGDMIAYLQSLEPVNEPEAGTIELGLVPRALINSGAMGDLVRPAIMQHDAVRPEINSRGEYLALVGGCDFCHGPTLQGGQGPEPGAPPGPDITGSGRLAEWDLGTFVAVMTTGYLPEGRQIYPLFMPWKGYRNMTVEDLRILFDYLRTLPDNPAQESVAEAH